MVFWPVLGRGHEKSGARAGKGKPQFLGARGPEIEKKMLPRYPGWLSATFLHVASWSTGPPGAGNTGFLGPFGQGQPLAEIPGRKRKNAISWSQGHFWGANLSARKVSPQNCASFLHFVFWPTGPPGREIAKYRVSRPFWPRAAPWHWQKFRAENRKTQFPGARGTFGEKICPLQKFLPEIAQLVYILRFGRPDPR